MDYPKYNLAVDAEITVFEFKSIGKTVIEKVIKFSPTDNELVYNLGFGDKHQSERGFTIDDKSVSNNGDTAMILATIANAVFIFTQYNPDKYVFFSGVTPSRVRLYRMAISVNYEELSRNFIIFGIVSGREGVDVALPFASNMDVKGFLIKRK
ncbi:DUF6934 family protein [Flavobacterium sp. RHBU_3]|uniref:DUF6934 family protein n=1 Tax=Flavobacterium sp. RHBU_3 TaxID=3391184 RepID=UPI00398507FA